MSIVYRTVLVLYCFVVMVDVMAQQRRGVVQAKCEMEVVEVDNSFEIPDRIDNGESQYIRAAQIGDQADGDDFLKKFELGEDITGGYKWFYGKNVYRSERKYGIVNSERQIVLPNIFECSSCRKTQLCLKLSGLVGCYDLEELRWVIPLRYELVQPLSNGQYLVRDNGRYGIHDAKGKIVTPTSWITYRTIQSVDNYLVIGMGDSDSYKLGIYSLLENKMVVPTIYDKISELYDQNLFMVELNDRFNVIDFHNTLQFKSWYDEFKTLFQIRNRFIVRLNNHYGVIDCNENCLVPIEYIQISEEGYRDGSYLAQHQNGKYGCVTLDGNITLPFVYDEFTQGPGNCVVAVKDDKCNLIIVNQGAPKAISTSDYDEIVKYKCVFLTKSDQKYGLLNSRGSSILDNKYDQLRLLNSNDCQTFVDAQLGKKHYLFNVEGKPIIEESILGADIIHVFGLKRSYRNEFSFFKIRTKNKKYMIVDKVGAVFSKPLFDDVGNQYRNTILVCKKGKWGFYDLTSKSMLIDFEFDLLTYKKDHFIGVKGSNVEVLKVVGKKLIRKVILK